MEVINRCLASEPTMGGKASAVSVCKPRPSRSQERQPEIRLRARKIPQFLIFIGFNMKSINFILPGIQDSPVGGYKVIYEYANYMVANGFHVNIIHPKEPILLKPQAIHTKLHLRPRKWFSYYKKMIDKSYYPTWFDIDRRVNILWTPTLHQKYIPDANFLVTTGWQTIESVSKYDVTKGVKFYIVQDYETYMSGDQKIRDIICSGCRQPLLKIVYSPAGTEMLKMCLVDADFYIPIGVDFKSFKLTNEISDERRKTIGFPTRSGEYKGTQDAIAALELLREKNDSVFDVWSFGRAKPGFIPSWIKYYESPSDNMLCELYNSSSIFVTASHFEGWGLPGAEAMSCGAALVSTMHGGINAYAENENTALLSPPKNVNALYKNIERLIKDRELLLNIAGNGQKFIQQFKQQRVII
jgi:glycosyltransferase involved in cell wall biosynthesis